MAYTYEEFLSNADKNGLLSKFSKSDLDTAKQNPEFGLSLLQLNRDAQNKTKEQNLLAGETANQLRKTYGADPVATSATPGYTSQYAAQIGQVMDKINNYGDFTYSGENQYKALLDSIANQQPFSYDLESDPMWSAARKSALREADRAAADTLASVSASSGGKPSSYAVTAAQQAGNYFTGQLSDLIPTLQQNSYERYLSDLTNKLNSLSAMEGDRAFNYQDWLNRYNMLGTSLGNLQTQEGTDYERYLMKYQQEQQKLQNALSLYQTLGYATPEIAEILGIEASAPSSTGGGTYYYDSDPSPAPAPAPTGDGLENLWSKYPSGKITSLSIWNNMVAEYGEDALKEAGFYYQAPEKIYKNPKGATGSGGPLGKPGLVNTRTTR